MIQCRFKNAEHCVVNTFDFKNFTVDSISHAEPIDLRCWKFRLNKLVELLGVTMDEHFSWIEHVKALLSSCYGVLSVLRKLRNLAPFHVRKQLGECLILSKLDYSCAVFHPLQLYQQKQLQKVQNVCASFVLGRYAREADSLQLGWLPVAERRQFQVLLSAFKALYFNNWPEYIKVDQYVP